MTLLDRPESAMLTGSPTTQAAALQRFLEAGKADPAQLKEVARDFESILLHRLMEEMRKTIPKSGLGEDATADQVEGLFWFHLAEEVARKGGFGLGEDLCRRGGLADQEAEAPPVPESEA